MLACGGDAICRQANLVTWSSVWLSIQGLCPGLKSADKVRTRAKYLARSVPSVFHARMMPPMPNWLYMSTLAAGGTLCGWYSSVELAVSHPANARAVVGYDSSSTGISWPEGTIADSRPGLRRTLPPESSYTRLLLYDQMPSLVQQTPFILAKLSDGANAP
jgi:hypothetical protein